MDEKSTKPAVRGSQESPAPASPLQDNDQQMKAFDAYVRIFKYGTSREYALQFIAMVSALASGVGMALSNLIFGEFITVILKYVTGVSSNDTFRDEVARLALYFFLIGLARFFLTWLYSTVGTIAAYKVARNIRHEYLKAALRQEIAYFDAGISGSIAVQATSNGKLIQAGIAEKLGLVFHGIAAFISAFVLAFVTQWKLTLIALCIAPATLLVIGICSTIEAGMESNILHALAQAGSFAESLLSSAKTIQAFGLRSRLVKDFDDHLQKARRIGDKKSPLFGSLFSAEFTIIYAGIALTFWQGIKMIANGEVSEPGDIFVVLMSVIVAATSLTAMAPYLIEFTRAASAAAELFKLIDRKSLIDPLDDAGEQPSEIVGCLDFSQVTFSYPMRPGVTILDNFSLQIPAGKVTALVGESGSGKSTIIGLIERWYNPLSGSVTLDGRSIAELNLNWLRKNIRLVQQEPVLFSGTVFQNICNGLIGTPWENEPEPEKRQRVEEAARIAFAHDFISALPDGYDTVIGERGGLLSGGQKQRVAIARSIISQPRVLLLDEATSALDPHAEEIVQKALDNASKGRTTITIAHKLATIRNADNIVVMRKGQILEQGTHTSLLAADGAYARLVHAQDLTVKNSPAESSDSETDDPDKLTTSNDPELVKSLTRYSTSTRGRMETQKERDNFDYHQNIGLLHVIFRLVKSTPELKWTYPCLLFGCLGAAAAFPGQAILMSKTIDILGASGPELEKKGNYFALMFFVLGLGCLVIYFLVGWSSNVVAQELNHKYRRQLLNDILRQDLQFFDRPENTTGALASRVDSYPQAILELMGFSVALILISTVGVLSCSVVAFVYGWKLALVIVLGGLPPLLFAGYARIRLEGKMDNAISKKFSASASIASESINAIRTVSSLAIEKSVLENYTKEVDHAVALSTKPILSIMFAFAFTQSVEYSFMALSFWYGCRLVSFGELSLADFFVAFLGVYFSGQQASILFGFSSNMTKARNAANYIFWLEQLQPTITETSSNREIGPGGFQSIRLDDVQFSYPMRSHSRVLKGINLEIKNGQFAAFVGASGCGKSTMISMLERFYDPTSGHIIVDSLALDSMSPRLYRDQIALVQQEPTLYPGSIRENISMGIPTDDPSSISDSAIETACRAANAWDFISSLPEGLNTPCGTNGLQLSGGQRQRIAIARALIRNPKVLLLDEATSALDTESERIVQDAINEAAAGDRITIAVAHRLSTIRHANMICVFDGGRIAEMGTHEELLALGNLYKKMCEAQSLT
ncbi:ABC transporter sequence aa1 from patent WO200132904-A2-penicillium chrysogenum [Hypomontagnella monticulosa]|nr:ABC transporter sequence aa1 from patent WO200132904-A2-penicillium chrysogenum [Hypomontagnella monticulosa]